MTSSTFQTVTDPDSGILYQLVVLYEMECGSPTLRGGTVELLVLPNGASFKPIGESNADAAGAWVAEHLESELVSHIEREIRVRRESAGYEAADRFRANRPTSNGLPREDEMTYGGMR